MTEQAKLFIDSRCKLGEGPFWHPLRQQFFWFDILAMTLFAADENGAAAGQWKFDKMVSAAGVIDKDTLAVAGQGTIFKLDLTSGAISPLVELDADLPGNRSNDGRVNPA